MQTCADPAHVRTRGTTTHPSAPDSPTRLGIACVALLAGFTAFAVARGDRRILAYLVTWSVLAALARAAHRRWPLPPTTLGLLWAASGLHLAGGLVPSPEDGAPILYETWLVDGLLKFDQVAHAAMSGIVTLACFQLLGHLLDPDRASRGLRAVLAMLVAWGFGAANELFEFLSALRFDDSYAGDLTNAGWDLAFNTAGSLTAAIALGGSGRRRPRRCSLSLDGGTTSPPPPPLAPGRQPRPLVTPRWPAPRS